MSEGTLSPTRGRDYSQTLARLARHQVGGDEEIESFLKHAVETSTEVLGVERASVWLYTNDRQKIFCSALYERSLKRHSSGAELTETEIPKYFQALRNERTIAANDAHTDPRTAELGPYLTQLGISSMLDAPIRVGGTMIGVVCNEHVGAARDWTRDEQSFAGSLSDLVSLAIEASELKKARAQLEEYSHTLEAKVEERTSELRDKQGQLAQAEKMAALGRLVAGIVHEINTPLGALHSNNDTVSRTVQKLKDTLCACSGQPGLSDAVRMVDSISELCQVNLQATERIINILSAMKTFSRLDRAVQDYADIHVGIDSVLTLIHHQLGNRIRVIKDYGNVPLIRCSPNLLNEVFMNLVVNAIQAISGEGSITVRTYADRNNVFVEVKDTGSGISSENIPRIFEPGFTTKGVRVGTGLGLAIAYRIVRDHQGSIDVESQPGHGSTFRVTLPIL